MGDYDFKPSGSLKLKGVKDKKIKKSKKERSSQPKKDEETASSADKESGSKPEPFVVPMTEAERRFEEIQRQRMEKRIEKSALKSHRERVDEMNKFLDSLSDVCFVRKNGLMGSIMICLKLDLDKEVISVEKEGEEGKNGRNRRMYQVHSEEYHDGTAARLC